jgi:hypothetical protein
MGQLFRKISVLTLLFFVLVLFGCKDEPEPARIGGWILSTDNLTIVELTLKSAEEYQPQILILSDEIFNSLQQLTDPVFKRNILTLVRKVHKAKIKEVILSDPGWYGIGAYPDSLKTNGAMNLDQKAFWAWLRNYYSNAMKLLPEADGIVVDLATTGDSIADQFSELLKTPEQKKAVFIDSLAAIVMGAGKKIYLRNFCGYDRLEKGAIENYDLITNKKIIILEKEKPCPFMVHSQLSERIKGIANRVVVEFDFAHLYEGQTTVASLFPRFYHSRWQEYQKLPNVEGFVYSIGKIPETCIFLLPHNVNLYMLHQSILNGKFSADEITRQFIAEKYGLETAENLKTAFEKCSDVIRSSYFTLGLATSDSSKLDFENLKTFTSLLPGSWTNKTFQLPGIKPSIEFEDWAQIVNHLAPLHIKNQFDSIPELSWLIADSMILANELMDTTWYGYIMAEKEYGERLAREALFEVKAAKPYLYYPVLYNELYHLFNRTLISARIRKSYAQVYYGQRIWNRGVEYQNDSLLNVIGQGVEDLSNAVIEMKEYSEKGPEVGYLWAEDGKPAEKLLVSVIKSGILLKPKPEAKK